MLSPKKSPQKGRELKTKIGKCDRCGSGPWVRLVWYNTVKGAPMQWLCPWCNHIAQTSRRNGLDPEEYSLRLDEVKECECCGNTLMDASVSGIGRGIGRFADVPLKGKLRGVLCWRCFVVVKYVKGSQSLVLKIFSYLNLRDYQGGEGK